MSTSDKPSKAEQRYLARVLSLAVHEFRTPLSVANGFVRFALDERFGSLTEKQREWLDQALRACGRLKELTDELSELGKLSADELKLASQDIDLNAMVTELASGMHEGEDRDVRIEVTASETPLPVRGDRARLSRALRGLMHGAVRERGTPGVIVANCSAAEDGGRTWAVLAIGQASLIEALRQQRDGVPFEYEWKGGMGLALPFARQIIEAHGGALWSIKNDTSAAASAIRLPLRT